MSLLIDLCVAFVAEFYDIMAQFGFIAAACLITFRHRIRRSAFRVAAELSCFFLVMAIAFIFLEFRGYGDGVTGAVAAFTLLTFFCYYAKIVRDGLHKLLFMFFAAFHIGGCLALLVSMLGVALGVREVLPIAVLITTAVYSIGGWAVYRFFAPPLRQIEARNMKWLWSVPAAFYFISEYLSFSVNYSNMSVIEPLHMALFLVFLVSSFAVCVLLLRVLDGVVKNIRLESDAEAVNRLLDMQREQYCRMMKNAETVKFMRHDMRHHLTLMGELARGAEELEKYIQSLSEKLEASQEKNYCANHAVNAVTAHYLGTAEIEGVTTEARLEVPEDTGLVPAVDLCVIMGNFLENAVEACRRVKRGNKFIRVRARVTDDALSVVVTNSFDGLWLECGKDGVYLSRKTEEGERVEGVGLSSVKAVCEKHRGLAQYEITGDVWKSFALVHMEGPSWENAIET